MVMVVVLMNTSCLMMGGNIRGHGGGLDEHKPQIFQQETQGLLEVSSSSSSSLVSS